MAKPKVLMVGKVNYAIEEWNALSDIAELEVCTSANRAEFIEDLKTKYNDVAAIYHNSVAITGQVDEEVLKNAPSTLKYICHHGAGYDKISIEPCTARGIKVANSPSSVDDATADVTMFLVLAALRNFNHGINTLRRGEWFNGVAIAHDPKDKVLGILGMGGIGRSLKKKAEAFGMTVQYHNRRPLSPELSGGAKYVSFDELLATSDVLSLNLPLNEKTHHIINAEAFDKMKDGIFIVNTARGAVMDEDALVQALASGKVANAGLDVFEAEPTIHPGLLANEKVMLLPHMGTYTVETRKDMEARVISNIRAGLETGKLINAVPEQAGMP
ncbi:D-isomer specific 2-hydroxyacid dehydrogenase [Dipodascopsis tothii]|uniref:D-isomer specific 2-hydroxyacid dehydrogenase n=1 Tax=Dipodascopsis tothii TaxID=44089 RepID=UPI0034CD9B57